MKLFSGALLSACAAALVTVAIAQEESKPKFTARELFYSASQAPKAPAPAAAPAKKSPSPPQAEARTAKRLPSDSAVAKTPSKQAPSSELPKASDLQPQSSDAP